MISRSVSRWLTLLCGLLLTSGALAQTMTLSSPSTGATCVDSAPVVLSISGEAGGIQNVGVVFTYLSGPNHQYIGQTFTMVMNSTAATQSFALPLATAATSSLLRSATFPDGLTGIPDGVYSVQVQYTRVATGAVVRSNTNTNITCDSATLPFRLISSRTATSVNAATDTITLANHGIASGVPLRVDRTNLPSTTTFYVVAVDASTFRLATDSDLSTIADITTSLAPLLIHPIFLNSKPVSVDATTDVITLANHGFADGDMVQIHGAGGGPSTVYFVARIDPDTFQLATTSGGSTFLDVTSSTSPVLYHSRKNGNPAIVFEATGAQAIAGRHLRLPYSFSEAYRAGSAQVKFTGPLPASSATTTLTLANAMRNNDFTFDRLNITATSPVTATTAASIPDGNYTIEVSYGDVYNHAPATVALTNITLDSVTQQPRFGMLDLRNGTTYTNVLTNAQRIGSREPVVYYTLPEEPLAGSAKLTFTNQVNAAVTEFILPDSASAHVCNLAGTSLPNGLYTVTLSYRDWVGNETAEISVPNISFDLETQAPTLDLGAATTVGPKFNVSYSLPEAPAPGSVKLIFSGATTVTLTLGNTLSEDFELDTAQLLKDGTPVAAATPNALPGGTYTVKLQYEDLAGNPPVSVVQSGFQIATTTAAAVVTYPEAGKSYAKVPLKYVLPQAAAPDSVIITFGAGGAPVATLEMTDLAPSAVVELDPKVGPGATAPFAGGTTTATGTFLPDGTYDVALTYRNNLGSRPVTTTVAGVVIDTATSPPTMAKPVAGHQGATIPIDYSLPEAASAVRLIFTDKTTGIVANQLTLSNATVGRFTLNPNALANSSNTILGTSSGDTLPEGRYVVCLEYLDALGNAAASVVVDNVTVDSSTQIPTLTSPALNTRTSPMVSIAYSLPEAPKPGSVKLRFVGTSTTTLNLNDDVTSTFVLNTRAIMSSRPQVDSASSGTIPEGTYTVVLSYEDQAGNASASISAANVTIDPSTEVPVLFTPAANGSFGSSVAVSYSLPETPAPGSVRLTFVPVEGGAPIEVSLLDGRTGNFTLNRENLATAAAFFVQATPNVIPDGNYTVILSYQDRVGNPPATATQANVSFGGAPTTSALTVTAVGSASATLSATINHRGMDTVANFYLGANLVAAKLVPKSSNPATVTHELTGLSPNTFYACSVQVQNVIGRMFSAPVSFTTENDDTETVAPILSAPVAGASATSGLRITYSLPETPKPGTVKLSFLGPVSAVLELAGGSNNFIVDPSDLSGATGVVISASRSSLPDGVYAITLSYQDLRGNAPAAATVTNVTIDSGTQPPALLSPLTESSHGTFVALNYSLPEAPLAGSVLLRFAPAGGTGDVTLALRDDRSKAFTIDRTNLGAAAAHISSASGQELPDGVYHVSLMYRDAAGNAQASVTHANVRFGSAPTITAASASVTGTTTATLEATVTPGSFNTIVRFFLGPTLLGSESVPAGTSAVTVTRAITGLTPFTSYAASLQATNVAGSVSSVPISFKTQNDDAETQAPTLVAPVAGAIAAPKLAVSYTLPETPLAGTVKLQLNGPTSLVLLMNVARSVSFALDPADVKGSSVAILQSSSDTIPEGSYSVTLTYQDAKGNSPASVTVGQVVFDRTTLPPVLANPPAASYQPAEFRVSYVLPEAPQADSVALKFTPVAGGPDVTVQLRDALSATFTLDRRDLAANSLEVRQASATSLPEGAYHVSLSYRDSRGNAVATVTNQNVTLGSLPAFSVPLVTVTGATTATLEVTVSPRAVDTSVEFFLGSDSLGTTVVPAGDLPVTVTKALTELADSTTYAASVRVTNAFGANASAPVVFSTTNPDAETEAPILISPVSGNAYSRNFELSYSLPEEAKAGTAQVTFIGPVTATFQLPQATETTMTIDPGRIVTGPAGFANAPVSQLPDGVYTVVLQYQDARGNAPASVAAGGVRIDTQTVPPIFISPAVNTVMSSKVRVVYQLPELPRAGTVKLAFKQANSEEQVVVTLNDSAGASFDLERTDLAAATANVATASASVLPNGTYDVTLSYQDELGNPEAKIVQTGLRLGTPPMTNPPNLLVLSSSSVKVVVSVAAMNADTVVSFLLNDTIMETTVVGAGSTPTLERVFTGLRAGTGYAVTVRAVNAFGEFQSLPRAFRTYDTLSGGGEDLNPPGFSSRVAVGRFERLAAGSSLPSDATYHSFGLPALNDAGTVAFVTRSRSSRGSRAAVVAGDPLRVIAVEGDAAPGVAGATFARFTDPVIDALGCVAFQATLAGPTVTPKNATSLWTNAPGGTLRMIARTGDAAPDAGAARFRSLTSFSLRSTPAADGAPAVAEVVFSGFLQVDPKAGVTAANDAGLWLLQISSDGTIASSRCVLREGVTRIDGSPVRVFRALDVVKNSPGHGRSHLAPGTVCLLATLADGRDVIVEVSADSGVEAVVVSRAPLGGPRLGDAVLNRLGVPALNIACDHLGFLGSLAPGIGGVTAATATGIFYAAPELAPLALVGDAAPELADTFFAAFRDPVMEPLNGELAFLSTLRGKGVAAGGAEALWWTRPTGLKLLARSGETLPGAEGTKLKSLTSLAFPPGSGPVFVGVLTSGSTRVTAANDTGLWIADPATGELTLLLRKGQKILDGVGLLKTVRNFAVLRPVAGSPGATRSYNSEGTLACHVTFEDGSESIIKFSPQR